MGDLRTTNFFPVEAAGVARRLVQGEASFPSTLTPLVTLSSSNAMATLATVAWRHKFEGIEVNVVLQVEHFGLLSLFVSLRLEVLD
jgi:hypothetical protein